MAAAESKEIWIRIAGLDQFKVSLKDKAEEKAYRQAEKKLNDVWSKYAAKYRKNSSNESIMAMVAFKFALTVVSADARNDAVASFLKEFERQLDEIVVKI